MKFHSKTLNDFKPLIQLVNIIIFRPNRCLLRMEKQSLLLEIEALLHHYSTTFEVSEKLSLPRTTDHKISLLEGTNPVNV